ncbi:Protein kinase superfamily protein [Rhynchospora pubera]|uniref:[RNA-polymerase]-subunit kinase n=1 Tax=Rhynchospora pubera TaxID=906938 RepID=A0AAV8DGD1_9POAL|nr:Protein kinase superfamily protein [Rhynchospora pubera]
MRRLMGCLCFKAAATTGEANPSHEIGLSSKSSKPHVTTSTKEQKSPSPIKTDDEAVITRVKSTRKDSDKSGLKNATENKASAAVDRTKRVGSHRRRATVAHDSQGEIALGTDAYEETGLDIAGSVPSPFSGDHTQAGWPTWLSSVSSDAIRGWSPRRADSFHKLDKIGQGTYSSVYKARDLETGKIVALKKVRFINKDPESVRFMVREINILRRLDHPNVIKLEGIITSRMSQSLYLVFEYMEHDLAGLIASPGVKFTEPQVKCFMQQLLQGLYHCHTHGVLHRDIKGSNLLIDNNGTLKIGDFGLATLFDPHKSKTMTSRVVTLWYRPPELLLGATDYGVAVDLWSTGCILGELLAGKPIMPGRTEVEQLHKIFKLCGSPSEDYWRREKLSHATVFKPQNKYKRCVAETFKDFPASALSLLETLLSIEPEARGTSSSALQSNFFKTEPLACDPASLPKFPPSKEYDVKLREQKTRKKESLGGQGAESVKPGIQASKKTSIQDPVADLQKRQGQKNAKSSTYKYSLQEDMSVPNQRKEPGSILYTKTELVQDRASARCNGPQLRTQKSYKTDIGEGSSTNGRYNQFDMSEHGKPVFDRSGSTRKKDLGVGNNSEVFARKRNRIQYSGPLMPPGGNLEDMLKEHERLIQQAVRMARVDKDKSIKK